MSLKGQRKEDFNLVQDANIVSIILIEMGLILKIGNKGLVSIKRNSLRRDKSFRKKCKGTLRRKVTKSYLRRNTSERTYRSTLISEEMF